MRALKARVIYNANIQRRPLRSEAEKRASGGGPFGPERTGMTGYVSPQLSTCSTLRRGLP